jgi:hypothetical protein
MIKDYDMSHKLRSRLVALATVAVALFGGPLGATAHVEESAPCAGRNIIVEMLESQYDESARAIGVVSEEVVLEVFVSAKSGSWTVLITVTEGLSCVMAAGESWQETPQVNGEPESDGAGGHDALVKLAP